MRNADKRHGEDLGPSKRRRSFDQYTLKELSLVRDYRKRSFEHSPYSTERRSRLSNAGLFFCKDSQNSTLCIYCESLCYEWDENQVPPEQFHKIVSPTCSFVRAELQDIDVSFNDGRYPNGTPKHPEYLLKSKRLATFRVLTDGKPFAEAGFILCDGDIVKCFYCDGSMPYDRSLPDPLFEHVRRFPQCAFAKSQCGAELHGTTERLVLSLSLSKGEKSIESIEFSSI